MRTTQVVAAGSSLRRAAIVRNLKQSKLQGRLPRRRSASGGWSDRPFAIGVNMAPQWRRACDQSRCGRIQLVMNERGRSVVLALISGLVGLMTILVLNLLANRSILQYKPNRASRKPVPFSSVTLPQTQQDQTDSHLYSSCNVLELPKASLDFVGYWGGSVRGSGPLTGESLRHVGVVFGRRDDQVFFASELYSPAGQHMIEKPLVKMVGTREVLIEYEAEDDEILYEYSHRFQLLKSGRIAYDETVRLHERHGYHFLEVAAQHSLLMRITKIEEWRSFVRPAPGDVREGKISVSRQLRSNR